MASCETDGHIYRAMSDGCVFCGTARDSISKEEVERIWAQAEAEQSKRAADMPTEQDAINAMFSAYQRLRELGWREAIYCPKDGTWFDSIEPGSTGIHATQYTGEWPKGSWWVSDGGDLWPAHPCLFRASLGKGESQ